MSKDHSTNELRSSRNAKDAPSDELIALIEEETLVEMDVGVAEAVVYREIGVSARKGGTGMEERTHAGKRIPRPCASSSAWPCRLGGDPAPRPPYADPAPPPWWWYSGCRAGELCPLLPWLTLREPCGVASSTRSTRLPTQ